MFFSVGCLMTFQDVLKVCSNSVRDVDISESQFQLHNVQLNIFCLRMLLTFSTFFCLWYFKQCNIKLLESSYNTYIIVQIIYENPVSAWGENCNDSSCSYAQILYFDVYYHLPKLIAILTERFTSVLIYIYVFILYQGK